MYITLETDYAVRIVDILGQQKLLSEIKSNTDTSPRMDAKTISERVDVPLRFALKILGKLVSANIVRSFKGVYGGYELGRGLDEISLYDIVEVVEGNYLFSRCLEGDFPCSCPPNSLSCGYRKAFGDISDLVREKLKEMTFDKFVNIDSQE